MLTGIETAGLILAVFPVVVQLAEGYQKGCKSIATGYIGFHRTFQTLLQGVRLQKTRFYNNVRMLLSPLVDSDEELEALLKDPGGERWVSEELEAALQLRLHNSYQSYRDTIDRMQETLADFQKQLGISEEVKEEILEYFVRQNSGSVKPRSSKRINWALEWNKIKMTWTRKELMHTLSNLDTLNTSLALLLGDGEKLNLLERARTRKSHIQQLRSHANALYNFLAKQWPCSCEVSHNTKVFLRHQSVHANKDSIPLTACRNDCNFEISLAFESHDESCAWRGPVLCTLKSSNHIAQPNRSPEQSMDQKRAMNPGKHVKKTVAFQEIRQSASSILTDQISSAMDANLELSKTACSLCILNTPEKCTSTLGPFLEDECQISLTPSFSNVSTPQLPSLADLLGKSSELTNHHATSTANTLSTPQRLQLAVDLASSFFYIYGTPWYAQEWGKNQIKINNEPCNGSSRNVALVERHFPSKGKVPEPLLQNAKDAFMRLCICLEELCFGMPLESLDTYARYCPNGKADAQTQYIAARVLVDQIEERLGFCYYDAVRKCLVHSLLADATVCQAGVLAKGP